ncbi:hypothetical protein [Paenibacillus kribbensis]|uniref:hypothetical protein n=1 Tax=Paenibacillus kribbensis TaxID=172713 RepID=UPI001FCA1F97|nr:hypothetical protein [Paenibacillus kribbensis]
MFFYASVGITELIAQDSLGYQIRTERGFNIKGEDDDGLMVGIKATQWETLKQLRIRKWPEFTVTVRNKRKSSAANGAVSSSSSSGVLPMFSTWTVKDKLPSSPTRRALELSVSLGMAAIAVTSIVLDLGAFLDGLSSTTT